MANVTVNSDQMRALKNVVHLAGTLAQLDPIAEGNTKDGIPYLAFRGMVQCGEEAIYTVPFRVFVKSKKTDGSDSKTYANIKDWYSKAIPLTQDTENATKVDMRGSLTDNPYVNANGDLIEATQFNMQLFNTFKNYAAEITLEGTILSVTDEVRDDNPTGRGRVRFFTRDIFRNSMELKNIVVQSTDENSEVNMSTLADAGYVKGTTTTLFIDLLPAKASAPVKKSGGIGKQHVTEGTNYLEWVLTGAEDIAMGDDVLTGKIVKAALAERTSHLDEIKRAGYLGSKKSVTSAIDDYDTSRATASASPETSPVEDDDDFPL